LGTGGGGLSKGRGEGSVPSHGPVQLWGNGSHVPAANATLFGGLNISKVPPNPPPQFSVSWAPLKHAEWWRLQKDSWVVW